MLPHSKKDFNQNLMMEIIRVTSLINVSLPPTRPIAALASFLGIEFFSAEPRHELLGVGARRRG